MDQCVQGSLLTPDRHPDRKTEPRLRAPVEGRRYGAVRTCHSHTA
jgi:hypothetical protein